MKIFISYSWDNEPHKEWVKNLADLLTKNGVYVHFDQYDLDAGKNMILYMEKSLEDSDKVLIILTPNYNFKAKYRDKGVGFEYSLISQELFDIQKNNNKFIPILRSGEKEGFPGILKSLIFHDMRIDGSFESDFHKLLRIVFNKPQTKRPQLGNPPDLDINIDPILERSKNLKSEVEINEKRKRILEWELGAQMAWEQIRLMFKLIKEKADIYKEKTDLFYKSENNNHRCILIGEEGITVNFYWECPMSNYLENSSLKITIWNMPLSLENDISYHFEQPEQIDSSIYNFDLDADLNPIWKFDNGEIIKTEKLIEKYFAKLLDFISKAKRKKFK
jgi:hypothetical protein